MITRSFVMFGAWAFMANLAAFTARPSPLEARSQPTEWERVLKGAREEGKVVVLGPPGADPRKALTEGFQKLYPGIEVEYNGGPGSKLSARLLVERRAGQYLADAYIGGTATAILNLIPAGAVDPIKPALVRPDVLDARQWWGKKLEFADQAGQHNLVFATNIRTHIAVNPQLVKKTDLSSYRDLLNPKWRGKIVMHDPTVLGPGQGTVKFWYAHPELGKEFVRKFFTEQNVTISRDSRQALEWIARGQYLIHTGLDDLQITELMAKGLAVSPVRPTEIKEIGDLNVGYSSVVLLNRPPHPNAVKVYLNWLLSKEGQTGFSRASGYPSRRLDVAHDHLDPAVVPREGNPYLAFYKEEYLHFNKEVDNLVKELIGK